MRNINYLRIQYHLVAMTDSQKLQQLFAAALIDCSDIDKPPTRIFVRPVAVPEAEPALVEAPAPIAESLPLAPPENAGFSDAESRELGVLLDESQRRKTAAHRRQALTTLGVMVALVGGACGWFVQSPQRMQAFGEAIREIRSVGDVAAMVAKYQAALDKIGTRSNDIDEATKTLGASTELTKGEDPNMEAEMRTLMGSEGRSTGQRNRLVKESFNKVEAGVALPIPPSS